MNSSESKTDRHISKWFRFSLRMWFVVLTLFCIVVLLANNAWQRTELQKVIVRDGTLFYGTIKKHNKPVVLADGGGLVPRPPVVIRPSPKVEMRDSCFPMLGGWSEGSAVFCCYDSIEYHVSNVPMPEWVNEVLETGELRRISLRVNEPEIDVNLVTRNYGLIELELMGTAHDRHALSGIHRLNKLETLNIFAGFDVSFEKLILQGLPPKLTHLYMTKCNLKSHEIAALINCHKLESLTLRLGLFNLQAFSKTGMPETLKKAQFYGSRIVKEDLELLAACPSLTQLGLGANKIDLREMDGVSPLKSIEYLDLREATLDASTFRWLSKLSKLKDLDIRCCKFNDEDAKGIVLSPTLVGFKSDSTNKESWVNIMLDKTFDRQK